MDVDVLNIIYIIYNRENYIDNKKDYNLYIYIRTCDVQQKPTNQNIVLIGWRQNSKSSQWFDLPLLNVHLRAAEQFNSTWRSLYFQMKGGRSGNKS